MTVALQQMALRTHIQTSSSGMARTPNRCGKGLLLQSTDALQQMALRTHMQTLSSGMAHTPDRCGKGLLLQSTDTIAHHRAYSRCCALQQTVVGIARTLNCSGKVLLLQSIAGGSTFRHSLPGVRRPTQPE